MVVLGLRDYQQICLDHAKERNTIINLDTGRGKTLIAAALIEYFLGLYPSKKVAFLVPTRALVEQQAKYLEEQCSIQGSSSPPTIQRLVGFDQADWSQSDWDQCMKYSQILLGTAGVFQKAFVSDSYIKPHEFSLFVFDECHNATGNSPMACVMRDRVAPYISLKQDDDGLPRILGLTASFVNGSIQDMAKERRNLEGTLVSTIFCPDVADRFGDENYVRVAYQKSPNILEETNVIERHVAKVTTHLETEVEEFTKVLKRCVHVFEELGATALYYYIEKVILEQLLVKSKSLVRSNEVGAIKYTERLLHRLKNFESELKQLSQELRDEPLMQRAVPKSPKLDKLIELISSKFVTNGDDYCGIVFCEQVALVSTMAKQLNDAFKDSQLLFGAVAGTGYQTQADREEQLVKFKKGDIRVLVASAALEEGIDVSSCAVVFRYSSVKTTKAHIQGSGRARHGRALIYYFENDPEAERQKEASMKAAARNTSLALSMADLRVAAGSAKKQVELKHPYPYPSLYVNSQADGGEVNVYNCKQIFNTFCSMALGATVQPKKHLYFYSQASDKTLVGIRYPTPDGWQSKSEADYNEHWGAVNMDEVFTSERVKRKSITERRQMCFVFLVVIQLREDGFLDTNNKPVKALLSHMKRACPLDITATQSIRIKNAVFQSHDM